MNYRHEGPRKGWGYPCLSSALSNSVFNISAFFSKTTASVESLSTAEVFHTRSWCLLAFAGLWDRWTSPDGEVIESCTIVTCRANGLIGAFHERMPVILPPERWERWIDPAPADPASFADLLVPAPDDLLAMREASPRVNSPANEGEDLTSP